MYPQTLRVDLHAAPSDITSVVILATRTGTGGAALDLGLQAEGFEVRRCLSGPEVFDVFADALLGVSARPDLVLIGSRLYRQIREQLSVLIAELGWAVQLVVQLDDGLPGALLQRETAQMVEGAVLPGKVVQMASRQLANAQLATLCLADQRRWRASEEGAGARHVGEGP